MINTVIDGPHKGVNVHPVAMRHVALIDEPASAAVGEWDGFRYAHYVRTPEGFRLKGISNSPTKMNED